MELFTTIGKVERAEIQYEPNGRSRGTGVVQFDTAENAETAICKLSMLMALYPRAKLMISQPNSPATNMEDARLVSPSSSTQTLVVEMAWREPNRLVV